MSNGGPGPNDVLRQALGVIDDARVTATVRVAPTDAPVGPIKLRLAGEFALKLELTVRAGEIEFSQARLSIEPEIRPLPGVGIEGLGLGPEGTIQIRLLGGQALDFHRFFRQIPRLPRRLEALTSWLLPEANKPAPRASDRSEKSGRTSWGIEQKLENIELNLDSLTLQPDSKLDLGDRGTVALREISSLQIRTNGSKSLEASAELDAGETRLQIGKVGLHIDALRTGLGAEADLVEGRWKVWAKELVGETVRLDVPGAVLVEGADVDIDRLDTQWSSRVDGSFTWSLGKTRIEAVSAGPSSKES